MEVYESVSELLSIQNPVNGKTVYVKSYHIGKGKGGGNFSFDSTKIAINDGGLVFKGWVRQNIVVPDVYMFGAYGNWNATNQTGNDDTVSFQKCIDYIMSNENTMRQGGKRFMYIPSGNFRLSSLTILAPNSGFGFEMYGNGSSTNLWFNPTGNGIEVLSEFTRYRSIRFNGSLKAVYPDLNNPAIPYIFRFKLSYKYLDIDAVFDDCDVSWYNSFARVSGRGFTFRNGGAGMGGANGFLEIACDSDLIVAGDTPAMHSVESGMRHFKIHNNRFDVTSLLVKVTGTHAIKDYINGLTISNNEITLAGRLVYSEDCTLIKPIFCNNTAISSFRSSNFEGVVSVPRAIDVKDINNTWTNYIDENNIATSRDKGISFVHRYTDVNGLLIMGTTAKDLVFGVVKTTGITKNITIENNTFEGFGDLQDNTCIIQTTTLPIEVKITKNNLSSKLTRPKRWIDGPVNGASSILINNNACDSSFPVQWLSYTPKLRITGLDSPTATYTQANGLYQIDGNYVTVRIGLVVNETASSGTVGLTLPIPAIAEFVAISAFISGTGSISTLTNFNIANNIMVAVRASTEQTAQLMINPSTGLNLSQKLNNNFVINGEFRYRFK
ncbi:hypothetical protein [Acinetobacter lactucae]|uniref:hypothetical protein n=1 Tax=Acinetobacter lactucae TaxID=1785128 RepID=UPI00157FD970|nr:hypothetical protein [Acinetobacter lactucae]NUF16825.1 hypothetical protein [Acinetobacter lactucae]